MVFDRILFPLAFLFALIPGNLGRLDLPNTLLPDAIVPTLYRLTIAPFMGDDTPFYDCALTIYLKCRRRTNYFKFHSGRNLNLKSDHFVLQREDSRGENLIASITYNSSLEQVTIFTRQPILVNQNLNLIVKSFRADYISNTSVRTTKDYYRNHGFYRHVANKSTVMVLTQFQENHARTAFPCFDEPRFKAVFSVTIYRQKYLNIETRANAERKKTYHLFSGWMVDTYEDTLPISTYIVAFAAFNAKYHKIIEKVADIGVKSVKIRLIYNSATVPLQREPSYACSIQRIFESIENALRFMGKYFDSPYPMKKYDVIFSPAAPYAGMENMGLVVVQGNSACFFRLHIHEVVHQWVGNMVTPYWWGDIWLSEGFTTFFTTLIQREYYPYDWMGHSRFQQYQKLTVMRGDALGFLPPIEHKEIKKMSKKIDVIYQKAEYILYMLSSALSNHSLRKVFRDYYSAYKFSNVTHMQLFEFFKQINKTITDVDINIHSWFETWIHNTGFPIVIFTRIGEKIFARQVDVQGRNITWPIALTWSTNCDDFYNVSMDLRTTQFFMNETSVELPVEVSESQCFLPNPSLIGYFISVYDEFTWKKLEMMSRLVFEIPYDNRDHDMRIYTRVFHLLFKYIHIMRRHPDVFNLPYSQVIKDFYDKIRKDSVLMMQSTHNRYPRTSPIGTDKGNGTTVKPVIVTST